MKRFELHPPVKKVGMKRFFLFLGTKKIFFLSQGTKRFFSFPLFLPGGAVQIFLHLIKLNLLPKWKKPCMGTENAFLAKKLCLVPAPTYRCRRSSHWKHSREVIEEDCMCNLDIQRYPSGRKSHLKNQDNHSSLGPKIPSSTLAQNEKKAQDQSVCLKSDVGNVCIKKISLGGFGDGGHTIGP